MLGLKFHTRETLFKGRRAYCAFNIALVADTPRGPIDPTVRIPKPDKISDGPIYKIFEVVVEAVDIGVGSFVGDQNTVVINPVSSMSMPESIRGRHSLPAHWLFDHVEMCGQAELLAVEKLSSGAVSDSYGESHYA